MSVNGFDEVEKAFVQLSFGLLSDDEASPPVK